jgi:ABC-type polysaccharide/polyol phosphate export permease
MAQQRPGTSARSPGDDTSRSQHDGPLDATLSEGGRHFRRSAWYEGWPAATDVAHPVAGVARHNGADHASAEPMIAGRHSAYGDAVDSAMISRSGAPREPADAYRAYADPTAGNGADGGPAASTAIDSTAVGGSRHRHIWTPPSPAAGPPSHLRFRRRVRPIAMLLELVGARQLVGALVERDFRARYKQTKVGVAWAVVGPLLLMAAFTIFAGTAADFDTGGVPYPLFAYLALVPWSSFSSSINSGSLSIVNNLTLINKVYCPREVFPLACVGIAAIDAVISLSILAVLFVIYGEAPQAASVWVPVLLVVQGMFTVGAALVVSSLVVYVRDLRQVLPMALQFALLATPVAYSFSVVKERWHQVAMSILNPLAPVIDGYREAVLFNRAPDLPLLGIAAGLSAVWLVGGYLLFKKLETGFADVA